MLAGYDNPGSKDLDTAIFKMGRGFKEDDPRANTAIALKYIRCALAARLFILSKLLKKAKAQGQFLEPRKWLLLQLLPSNIGIGYDFWVELSNVFYDDTYEGIENFIKHQFQKMEKLTNQKQIPVIFDETQNAIEVYKDKFHSSDYNTRRPLYTILLRSIEWIHMNNTCIIMSGTGLKVEAIEKSSGSLIAKPGGFLTTEDFFGVIGEFKNISEMHCFIQNFLPLSKEQLEKIFIIMQGRYRFTIKFLEVIFKNEGHYTIDDGIERWLQLTKQYITSSLKKSIEKLSHDVDIWETMNNMVISYYYYGRPVILKKDSMKIIEVGFES